MSIQQLMLGVGASKKTYIDDVFSTYLYTGTGSAQTINNGINLSDEGGMVWIKQRGTATSHVIGDSIRGDDKYIVSNSSNGQGTNNTRFKNLTTTGFQVGGDNDTGGSSNTYSSWSFRKTKGFFDVVSYTGNGSNRTINHSLGSVPGLIMVKRTDTNADWRVYYRGSDGDHTLKLNSSSDKVSSTTSWNSTLPTATHFSLGTQSETNANGGTFIAYIFAGGESPAATARSIDFDGSGDYLQAETSDSSNFEVGTGDFTIECWINPDSTAQNEGPFGQSYSGLRLLQTNSSNFGLSGNTGIIVHAPLSNIPIGQWTHVAVTRSSGTVKLFFNGILRNSATNTSNLNPTQSGECYVGYASGYYDGKISNFRFVKGTAVYTSAFRPPTEPLTAISGTSLLCCNSSSASGSSGVSITDYGSPPTSTDSPFDDPAAFTFGENGDQGIVKCGTFIGNHTDKPEIHLGWEPQYLLWKNADQDQDWFIVDSMRGAVSGGNDHRLRPNKGDSENTSQNPLELTPTGFKCTNNDFNINGNGDKTFYIAIRRPDGYVGKPAEVGTDVFAMDAGNSSGTYPNYDSGFPVDFALVKKRTNTESWWPGARLISGKYLQTNDNAYANVNGSWVFDSNDSWNRDSSFNSDIYNSWMWKRGQGFDVVTYTGFNATESSFAHNLGRVPEMIWLKNLNSAQNWAVGHKGLNGGTNPWNYRILLNSSNATSGANDYWGGTSNTGIQPTSTHFFLGPSWAESNAWNNEYIAFLFASVSGISKVGSYTGNNSSSGPTVTTGFSPRFILIKRENGTDNWFVFDTLRGITNGGNDARLKLDENGGQTTTGEWLSTSSTGFTLNTSDAGVNASSSYIYYAHA